MKHMLSTTAVVCLLGGGLHAAQGDRNNSAETAAEQRLHASATVLTEMMGTAQSGIPDRLLANAQCVVVIPNMKRAAFIVGGRYGAGFASCRTNSGWSAPEPVQVEGGSVGVQIGGQESDIVMFLMNEKARNELLASNLTLGATASVQAGPVGTEPANTNADILVWKRINGAFAGVTLNGATLNQDDSAVRSLYGKGQPASEVLNGSVPAPPAAEPFLSVLSHYTHGEQ